MALQFALLLAKLYSLVHRANTDRCQRSPAISIAISEHLYRPGNIIGTICCAYSIL